MNGDVPVRFWESARVKSPRATQLFDEGHRDRLTTRIAGGLGQARREVRLRQVCHFFRADADYGTRVATKLGIDLSEVQKLEGTEAMAAGRGEMS
jgi:catalase